MVCELGSAFIPKKSNGIGVLLLLFDYIFG
jgi:hypothetical protein